MDESKPKANQPVEPLEVPSDAAQDTPKGDFTLDELIRAHNRNFDPAGRLMGHNDSDEYTPENGQQ